MSDRDIIVRQNILLGALRQYRHNDSDDFVVGYDKLHVDQAVEDLIDIYVQQRAMKTTARKQRDAVTAILKDLVIATEAVIAISDRKHDAWDAVKSAISKAKGETSL